MKRGRLEIIFDLLNATAEKGGSIKPTHLLYKSNLSHKKMKEYVEELIKKELIEAKKKDGKNIFAITEKGTEFVNEFRRIKSLSEGFGL